MRRFIPLFIVAALLLFGIGAATGILTGASAVIGGGFGSTGCTISAAGALSCDGAAILGSTLTVSGTTNLVGNVADSAGTFTINDDASVAGTLGVTGASTLTGAVTAANDVTVSPNASGGNAGQRNEISGLLRMKSVALGTMTNGTTETTAYMDDTPANEWTAISTTVTVANDNTIYRVGSNSLRLTFAAEAVDDNGAQIDIVNDDLSGNESIGFWMYSIVTLTAGDLDILIDDTDTDTTFDVCAYPTINTWQWCEVDISALDGTSGNVVDKVGIVLKNAAALGAFTIQIDGMYKWDSTDEEALGTAILTDGVYSVMAIPTGEGVANTPVMLAEGTDYFVNYESGSDFLVTVTDQSANSGVAFIGY